MASNRQFWHFILLCFIFIFYFPSSLRFSFFKSTEHDHIKDNLPVKLFRIRTFGKMKPEEFKDLLSIVDYKMCESKMDKNPT